MGSARKKQTNTKSRRGKVNRTKIVNKHLNKLAKQGKLKKNVGRKKKFLKKLQRQVKGKEKAQGTKLTGTEGSVVVEEAELEVADLEYYGKDGKNLSFVSTVQTGLLSDGVAKKKKRKRADDEEQYEQIPRTLLGANETRMKMMLPIKTKEGVVPQLVEETPADGFGVHTKITEPARPEEKKIEESEPQPELSSVELLARRQQKLIYRKSRIATLSSSVIENPEENVSKLKELRSMLKETDPDILITTRKLAMVSLMEVFKDIVPGYRIRIVSDVEKQQKAKKETKILRDYEESLLASYKLYLEFLEITAKGGKKSKGKNKQNGCLTEKIPPDAVKSMSEVAMKCMCEMLTKNPHFNYRGNLVKVIVPFLSHKNPEISETACESIKKVFREDKSGEVSLEIVRCIGHFVKGKHYEVKAKVLNTFLSLKIKEVDRSTPAEKKDAQKRRELSKRLSRKDRKRKKQMERLEHQLLETKATENKTKKLKLHTDTIQAVFLTYFRILKNAQDSILLPAVLEGLARFAHLINIEFFDDLFAVFHQLIDLGDLNYRESLHVVQTAFTILSGQGAALNIDPMKFYKHLYKNLFHLHAGETSDDIDIVLECLDLMVNKRRRQVSQQRLLAYTKRICTLTLQQLPHGAVSLMHNIRNFTQMYSGCDLLYDNESSGSGVYLPELDDPEHCNAQNTMLWELPVLTHHYHPVVCKYALHLCHKAPMDGVSQLPTELARKTPKELYREQDMTSLIFDPNLPPHAKKKKIKSVGFIQERFKEYTEKILQQIPDPSNGILADKNQAG